VEEVKTEVEERAGHGLTVNSEVLLLQVPATSTGDEGRQSAIGAELVVLAALLEVDLAANGIVQVDLAVDHVLPGRGRGVLEIGHVGPDIGVESVDDHLAVGRTGDLDAAVNQARSRGSTLPGVILTDVLSLGEEVEELAIIEGSLAIDTALEESLAGRVEGAVEDGEEGTGVLGENLAGIVGDAAEDGNTLKVSVGGLSHGGVVCERLRGGSSSIGY
jgi:hypothetical protein